MNNHREEIKNLIGKKFKHMGTREEVIIIAYWIGDDFRGDGFYVVPESLYIPNKPRVDYGMESRAYFYERILHGEFVLIGEEKSRYRLIKEDI